VSIKVKSFLIILTIVMVATAFNFGMSIFLTRRNLVDGSDRDLAVIGSMAENFVANEISLLKVEATSIALSLDGAPEAEMQSMLNKHAIESQNFIGLAVFNADGIIYKAGGTPANARALSDEAVQAAFSGKSIISSTVRADSREVVFYVNVPMSHDRVLTATVPGMVFSDLIADYQVWETGNISIIDPNGTVIGSSKRNLVIAQTSFLDGSKRWADGEFQRFLASALQRQTTSGTFDIDGVRRQGYAVPIDGSAAGWILCLSAPLSESPLAHLERGLIAAAIIFLLAGVGLSALTAPLLARPIEERYRLNNILKQQKQEAEEASEAKSHFLANTSHEMRTPLNAIIGLSALQLDNDELPQDYRNDFSRINAAGNTLLSIVNDILDISKIEAGRFELMEGEYDMASLINDTVMLNTIRANEKPITFSLELDAALPSRLYGDELRVRQIFNNLLSNAFKYTRAGEVVWKLRAERDAEGLWLISEVSDTGIGIRAQDIDKLFGDYAQLDRRSNRAIEGTGLGLAIVRKMAQLMDGGITVSSEYGQGSCFTVRLRQGDVGAEPLSEQTRQALGNFAYAERKHPVAAHAARLQLPYAHVLVVDDISTNLDVAKGLLKRYGMMVDCVTSGEEAIELIRAGQIRYKAILMDHMMPGMDGVEATRIIREEIGSEYARTVPIIALTANAMAGSSEFFLSHGFVDFIAKPIDAARMDAVIRKWVRDKHLERELDEQSERSEESERSERSEQSEQSEQRQKHPGEVCIPTIAGIDTAAGLQRLDGDKELYIDLLRSYHDDLPALLAQLNSPDADNLALYAVTVHGIKGASRAIGAEELGEAAYQLELAAKRGDLDFVARNNDRFVGQAEELIACISV
jgi:signal transduction histidine kinase/CheY-like chemotaxis protein/HPt (histidine-containing phosphotransfer) domain-containing protein